MAGNAVTPRETSPLLGAGSVQRSPEVVEAPEQDGSVFGPWIKPLVYGGMDGIVSVFVGVIVAVLTDKVAAARCLLCLPLTTSSPH